MNNMPGLEYTNFSIRKCQHIKIKSNSINNVPYLLRPMFQSKIIGKNIRPTVRILQHITDNDIIDGFMQSAYIRLVI